MICLRLAVGCFILHILNIPENPRILTTRIFFQTGKTVGKTHHSNHGDMVAEEAESYSRILHSFKSVLIGLMRNDASVEISHVRSFVAPEASFSEQWFFHERMMCISIFTCIYILMQDVCVYLHVTKYPP